MDIETKNSPEKKGKYTEEINELFEIAQKRFGTPFLDKLEELSKDYDNEGESGYLRYTLTINNTGAFYAGQK